MTYNFDEIIDRRGTRSVKLEMGHTLNPYLPADYLPLWVADMDFACAPPIMEAMHRRLDRRILGYTMLEDDAYTGAVVQWMQRRYDWDIQPEWIVFSNGIVPALYTAVDCLTVPGDEVLFLTPAYMPFYQAVKRYERMPLYSRLIESDGYYTIDWTDLERKASQPACKMLFLCNPHNPTGRVWTADELRRIGEICFNSDVFIVSDEIHADLLRIGQRHIPLAKLFPKETRLITCTAPSKTFNVAGNQHANLIIPAPAVRERWHSMALAEHPNALSVDATIAAYTQCDDWLDALRVYLDGSFAGLKETLTARLPKAVFAVPEGTYLAWVNLSKLGLADDKLRRLVSEAGVFAQLSGDFVDNDSGCMRLNIACPRAVLAEAVDRIAQALGDY